MIDVSTLAFCSRRYMPMIRTATMEYYVGLDVSLKQTSICVVDQAGLVVREGVVQRQAARVDPDRGLCGDHSLKVPFRVR
jgi:hypothetical protein